MLKNTLTEVLLSTTRNSRPSDVFSSRLEMAVQQGPNEGGPGANAGGRRATRTPLVDFCNGPV